MTLAAHPRKRIDIFIEAPLMNRVIEALDHADVTGYTVLPAMAGRGRRGEWRRDDAVNIAGQLVCVVCITGAEKAEAVLAAVHRMLARQIGIVTVSDVNVIRADHF